MKRVTLRERGRIFRQPAGYAPPADSPDACWVEARVYERLLAFDRTRGDGEVFDWRVDHARLKQWVGVIQVPGLTVEILPKIDEHPRDLDDETTLARDNLLVMLAEAGAIPLRVRDLAQLGARQAPLHDTLILLFARGLRDELLRGVDRGYITEVDDLRMMRGKLLIGRHIARNTARRERFTCAVDEFRENTELNRVLKACCRLLLEQTRSAEALEALRQCVFVFDEVQDESNARALLDRIVLSHRNARFAHFLSFCRLVLEQSSPTASSGRNTVFSLLFDMERVFEDFIAAMMQRAVRNLAGDMRVYPQGTTRRRYLMDGDQGGVLHLKPDLLLEGSAGRLVIDTKWKRLAESTQRRQAGLSAADLYQLYAYSQRYGAQHSLFLFPFVNGALPRDFAPLCSEGRPIGSAIGLRFVHLHGNLRKPSEFRRVVTQLERLVGEAFG